MWKLLREKVGVPSLCWFFWVLMFDLFRITFSGGGDQQTTGPIIQVEATLYLLHLSVARSHTWVLRKAELCKSIFASHNRVFCCCFGFSYFKWFWCLRFSSDKWFRPTDVWSHVPVEATLYLLDLTFARSHMWVLNYIKVFMLYTHMFYFTVVILHAS